MNSRKIVIAGGTGALGAILISYFKDKYDEIIVLTRDTSLKSIDNIKYVVWDAESLSGWETALEHSDAIINLVGKSVNCRYTAKNRQEIISSRVNSTNILGIAIKGLRFPPQVWINAGSAAIFGNSGSEVKTEDAAVGNGFSPEVCKRWENAFNSHELGHTRKVFLRIGMVLQAKQGILVPFVNMAKFGLGGRIGSGEQYMTWIHQQDFSHLVAWAINNNIEGILHAASPNPEKNGEFMRLIRKARQIPFGLPNPAFLIKLGAPLIGTEAELVLSGRRVVSKKLAEQNFQFQYPHLEGALVNLLR